ncbi:MAG: protein kinase [Alphaproteobacteria bacterium]|nr:protein kinase [Alphaproteobacteria bacterium]MCB9698638.1 protein kinase [Alphaproteobacteria bacterium]
MTTLRLTGFELQEPIGRGGSGSVWRARHRSGVDAAVKVLVSDHAKTPRWQQAFEREIHTIAGLRHPGIVDVYDSGIVPPGLPGLDAGSPWLAMSWVDDTLSTWLRAEPGRRTWAETRRILLELLDALAHAHARGVIHLDIKPQNVLVDATGRVRLADFGIASRPDDDTHDSSSGAGTPLFMAPERFHMGHPPVPATDLYSVGCLTWWLAAGRPPFHLPVSALPRAHMLDHPGKLPLPNGWPPGLSDWTEVMLAKFPGQRFERAADAAHALRGLSERGAAPKISLAPLAQPTTSDTWQTDSMSIEEPPPAPPPVPARHLAVPPLPPRWPATAADHRHLTGAGLGLFGLRALPLVDREHERDVIWDALRRVTDGEGAALVWLRGPSGIGKSRLADELVTLAHASGAADVLVATHGPAGGGSHGFAPMIARWLPTTGLPRMEIEDQIRRRLPDASPDDRLRLSEWIAGEPLRPEERDQLVRVVLRQAASRRPVVWWLDDLDHAPEAVSLIAEIVASDLPILVVATSGEDGVPGLDAVPARTLDVGPLTEEDTRTLLGAMLGLDEDLADRVTERAGGMPLFAVQLVGDWVRRGVLDARGGGLTLVPGARADLPDDLHRLWMDRLGDLPSGAAETLEVAAALGGLVSHDEWQRACRIAGFDMRGQEEVARRGLLIDDTNSFRVAHQLLREALDRRCREGGRWQSTHRACAEALLPDQAHPLVGIRRARHLLESGEIDGARDIALTSAQALRRLGDFRAAARAVAIAEQAAGDQLLAVLDLKARVEVELGAFAAAEATCGRVLALATDDPRAAGTALRLRGGVRTLLGDRAASERDLRDALPLLERAGDHEQVGDCHQSLALVAAGAGRYDEARTHLDHAEQVWKAAQGPAEWFAWLDWARADIELASGNLALADAAAERAALAFDAAGRAWQAMMARGMRAEVSMESGRFEEARVGFQRQREQADALGVTGAPRWLMDATRAINDMLMERYDEAEEVLDRLVRELEGAGWERRALGAWAALALCQVARGAEDEADRSMARVEHLVAEGTFGDRTNRWILGVVQERLVLVDLDRAGRLSDWLEALEET